MAELLSEENTKESKTSNKSRYQEMHDTFEIMKIERRKHLHNKLVLNTINKCLTESSELSDEVKNKVKDVLLSAEVGTSLKLRTKHFEETLLGLSDLCISELSYKEQEEANQVFHNNLKLMEDDFMHSIPKLMEAPSSIDLFHLNIYDKSLLEERDKLESIQETYIGNLKVMYDLLQELLKLRFHNVKDLLGSKLDEYSIKSKIYDLQSEMIKKKTRVDIFNENSLSFVAYEKLVHDITDQQKECQKQIDDLIDLKERYKLVACKQYDDILRSYLQYKTALEQKKGLYKQLQSK
ncbi:putative DNA-(apurinic or apyrimidinic site) lyase [Trypoxylus dichotomus]